MSSSLSALLTPLLSLPLAFLLFLEKEVRKDTASHPTPQVCSVRGYFAQVFVHMKHSPKWSVSLWETRKDRR